MKQAEDRRTPDLPGIETGNGGGRMPDAPVTPRGAYKGAVKIGCRGHELRARTGLSQAEFCQRAGVSERSLRTWEAAQHPASEAPKCHAAIVACLARLGVTYAQQNRQPVRYRCKMTGSTWSGRGLMPVWLRVALDDGKKLADFEV